MKDHLKLYRIYVYKQKSITVQITVSLFTVQFMLENIHKRDL